MSTSRRFSLLRLAGTALIAVASLQWMTGSAQGVNAAADPPRAEPVPRVTARVAAPTSPEAAPAAAHRSVELTPAAARELLALAHRTADDSKAAALFEPKSWYSPPPPPPQETAPPPDAAPTAPPLPFAFLGRYTDANDVTVYFITRDDRVYDVKPGDVIDTNYTLESASGGQIIFLYKPLDVRQSLATGEAP